MLIVPVAMRRVGAWTASSSARVRRRPAAAAVEFAMVAPFLVALIFGIIEFGRAFMTIEVLNNAARNGCRAGILPGADDAAIDATVTNSLSSTGVNGVSSPTVKVNGTTANASTAVTGDSVSVSISVPVSSISWLPMSWFLPGSDTLVSTAVMRRE